MSIEECFKWCSIKGHLQITHRLRPDCSKCSFRQIQYVFFPWNIERCYTAWSFLNCYVQKDISNMTQPEKRLLLYKRIPVIWISNCELKKKLIPYERTTIPLRIKWISLVCSQNSLTFWWYLKCVNFVRLIFCTLSDNHASLGVSLINNV